MVKRSDPVIVDELGTAQVSLAEIQRVLRDLLSEGVAIRDLGRIFEVLTEKVRTTRDPEALVEACRAAIGPTIAAAYSLDGTLPVLTLAPAIEQMLMESLKSGDAGTYLGISPQRAEQLALTVAQKQREAEQAGEAPVLLCAAPVRSALHRLIRTAAPRLAVLSYAELGQQLRLETKGLIDLAHETV
jgi:flagellar biosynthesis protein FlhA